jgi:hypothetical protein
MTSLPTGTVTFLFARLAVFSGGCTKWDPRRRAFTFGIPVATIHRPASNARSMVHVRRDAPLP